MYGATIVLFIIFFCRLNLYRLRGWSGEAFHIISQHTTHPHCNVGCAWCATRASTFACNRLGTDTAKVRVGPGFWKQPMCCRRTRSIITILSPFLLCHPYMPPLSKFAGFFCLLVYSGTCTNGHLPQKTASK